MTYEERQRVRTARDKAQRASLVKRPPLTPADELIRAEERIIVLLADLKTARRVATNRAALIHQARSQAGTERHLRKRAEAQVEALEKRIVTLTSLPGSSRRKSRPHATESVARTAPTEGVSHGPRYP